MRKVGFQFGFFEYKLRSGTLREHSREPHFIVVCKLNMEEGVFFFGPASCGPRFAEVFVEAMETGQLPQRTPARSIQLFLGADFEFETPPWE